MCAQQHQKKYLQQLSPLTSTLQRDRPAFYAQMAAPTGGKSVPSHRGAVFGQLCLRVIPVTCPLAHHLA